MSAGGYLDGCGFIPASGGTGDFVVSTAVVGYGTPANAGAVNAMVYTYRAESADRSQWEIGFGAYTTGTTTLARTSLLLTSTGSKVSFTSPPNVYVTASKADLQNASLLTGGTLNVALINGGNANQFVQGDGSFQTQGRKLINTLTASSSSTLTDTTSLTSAFNDYEIIFQNILPATNAVFFQVQVTVAGVTQTTNYSDGGASAFNAGQSLNANISTALKLSGDSLNHVISNTAGLGLSGTMRIFNVNSALAKVMTADTSYFNTFSTPTIERAATGGHWNSSSVPNGLVFSMSSGAIASGKIKILELA